MVRHLHPHCGARKIHRTLGLHEYTYRQIILYMTCSFCCRLSTSSMQHVLADKAWAAPSLDCIPHGLLHASRPQLCPNRQAHQCLLYVCYFLLPVQRSTGIQYAYNRTLPPKFEQPLRFHLLQRLDNSILIIGVLCNFIRNILGNLSSIHHGNSPTRHL